MGSISIFAGEFEYLSNLSAYPVIYEGLEYPASENAFQAAKIHIPGDERYTNKLRIEIGFTTITPATALKVGRAVQLREDWESVKQDIMLKIIRNKFNQNYKIRDKLLDTYPRSLRLANTTHDNYWGDCCCNKCSEIVGKNVLGEILMKVRDELLEDEKNEG